MAGNSNEVILECHPCGRKFPSQNDLTLHLESRKHRKQAENENDVRCGVYITDLPYNKSKEDVLQYFSKFGGIRKSIVGPTMSYMIIVYENEVEATALLSTQHFIDGRKLRIERRQRQLFIQYEDQDHEIHERLVQCLKPIADFENQVKTFVHRMTPHPQQIWNIYNLVNMDVQRALYGFFPHYNIYNFGSSVTSTQFNSSDLDIYLDFREQPTNIKKSLKLVRSALSKSRQFHNIIDIPSAKVPIVRFVHNQTGIKGDINFVNRLGVENSKLIKYFLSLDSKLRCAILVVKYWAKKQEICGRNHLFTSYSMVMMFIFYLQQRHSFPSVHQLQCSTKPTDPEVIWNMNIIPMRDIKKINKIHSVPLLDILKGFFEYYSTFDFNSRIICPYLGKTVEKVSFEDISTVPKEFELYKKHLDSIQPLGCNKPVCLQDPFEHNINTCRIIFVNILDRFIAACSSAVKIMSSKQEKILVNLFSSLEGYVAPKPKTIMEHVGDPDSYNICLKQPSVLNYLESDTEGDLSKLWFNHTLDYCHTVFEKVLRLELKEMENNKCARVGTQQDVHDCGDIKRFHAISYINVWNGHNKHKETTKTCKTSLEKDIERSASIWKENEAIRHSTPMFECNIILTCLKEPSRINIEFTKISSYKKIYKSFGMYITSKLPQWFLLHTKELNQQENSK